MTEAELLSRRLLPEYNCAHFLVEAWEHETGRDIRSLFDGFLALPHARRAMPRARGDFVRIHAPVSPCIVLFRRVKATPHVGLFVRGRVLHLTDAGPVRQLLSVARIGYTTVRFYASR